MDLLERRPPSPWPGRFLQVMMLLLMGLCVWFLADTIPHAWERLVLRESPTPVSWRDYGRRLSPIAMGIFLTAYCLRRLRHASIPDPRWFYAMTVLMGIMILLNLG